jgi:P4 family phage/plasmid primase-like protien
MLKLLPFSPAFRRRNKLAIPYDPQASCPQFLDRLMRPALEDEDSELLQRWCGQALIGINLAQVILFLIGTPGGGKGTFIRILNGIIGAENLATFRSSLLMNRFEISGFVGKTLLYGADVAPDFLNCSAAAVLKSLTGGDPITVEFKGSNVRPRITGQFNVAVSCNSHLKVKLHGDIEAWRRRLRIIEYSKAPPQNVIADFDKILLEQEASGILNWALAGFMKLREDRWRLHQSLRQQRIVDDLLGESDSGVRFVRDILRRSASSDSITVDECYERFNAYCVNHGWDAITKAQFSGQAEEAIRREFGFSRRNDIIGPNGKAQRGWKGIGFKE